MKIFTKIFLALKFILILIAYTPKIFNKKYYHVIAQLDSVSSIDVDKLKSINVRNIIFDWEYTLAQPDSSDLDKNVEKKFHELKKDFHIMVLTNNHTLLKKIEKYDIKTIMTNGMKPSRKAFMDALAFTDKKETIFIGDSWLTDIIGANNVGLKSIRVKPLTAKIHNVRYFFGRIFRWVEEFCKSVAL